MQCNSLKESTNNIIEEFIKKNPYPEFEEMGELLSRRLDLDSEYCEWTHDWCEKVYSSMHLPDNKKYVVDWVIKMKNTSYHTLKCNLDTILLFSPIAQCKEAEVLRKFKEIYDYVMSQLIM